MISLIRDKCLFLATKDDRFTLNKEEFNLVAFFSVYLIAWVLLAALLPLSTEMDSIEEVVWSQSWQWGYYKHPPLPSALLHSLNSLLGGPSIGLTAFAAESCSVVALIYVWLLAKQMLSRKQAVIAVLLTSLIAYHNSRALTFNHNTVSLPFTAAALYYFYCALRHPKQHSNWLCLGLICGLAMLTKYSAVLIFASFFIYLFSQRLLGNTRVILGMLISSAVFMLVLYPHVLWLAKVHWLPFTYLQDKLAQSGNKLVILVGFLADQVIRLSFTFPLLLGIGYLRKKGAIKAAIVHAHESTPEDDDLRYLLTVQFTPLILAMMPTLLTGSQLNHNWASAFFLPAGILVTKCFFYRFDETQLLKYTQALAWLSHAAILVFFFSVADIYPSVTGRAVRLDFPSRALADKVTEIWQQHQKVPLAIVISDPWEGGNIMLHARPEPTLFIDHSSEESPWVNALDVDACGAFVLFDQSIAVPKVYAKLVSQATTKGEFSLIWGHAPRGEVVHYQWAIMPPLAGAPVCRFTPLPDNTHGQ